MPEERRGGKKIWKKRKGESTMGEKMSRWSGEVQEIGKGYKLVSQDGEDRKYSKMYGNRAET